MVNKIAFVPPRYGKESIGGAEAVIAEAAQGLASRGYDVEILTTCAKDHFTWENEYPPGVDTDEDLLVRRFLVDLDTPGIDREKIGGMILSSENVSVEAQQLWANDSLRSSNLWHYVSQYGHDYAAFIFAPYQFWTTYAVSQIYPNKSIIMPCMHEEPEAYLDIYQPVINGAGGVWFLTEPEANLAHKIFEVPTNNSIVGAAVDIPSHYDVENFREKYQIKRPYIYYAGRREWGKNWQGLFQAYKSLIADGGNIDLQLVTSGVGDTEAGELLGTHVIDVGFLSDDDRNSAMAGALAYVQPSARESFSRTVLESWLSGTFVIANAQSDVVKWHIDRSKAGFYYYNQSELIEALRFVAENPLDSKRLAKPGRSYVLDNFTWPSVLDRMEETLFNWMSINKVEQDQ